MKAIVFLVTLLLVVQTSFADSSGQKCVGPITTAVAGIKYFDFGTQNQGYNDTFTLTAVVTGTASVQVRASLDSGCKGGPNNGAACTTNSQCPSGVCTSGVSSGMQVPYLKNTSVTVLPAITATGIQQFDGPWNVVQIDVATCTACTFTYNICGKDL